MFKWSIYKRNSRTSSSCKMNNKKNLNSIISTYKTTVVIHMAIKPLNKRGPKTRNNFSLFSKVSN